MGTHEIVFCEYNVLLLNSRLASSFALGVHMQLPNLIGK